jgi:DNA-binding CsgD family transcriptional regulator/polyhydroxyalkanoate synthesis regulator phasin
VHPDDRKGLSEHINGLSKDFNSYRQEEMGRIIEYRVKIGRGGSYRCLSQKTKVLFDKEKRAVAIIGNVRDITERKKAEEKLLKLIDQLERKGKAYSASLEEKNAALKVLLKQNQDVKAEMEEKISLNIKTLIMPLVHKLKHGSLKDMQEHIDILESDLNRLTSSFSSKVTSTYLNLSHQEIQVANYIMHGKITKEIGELMGLSNRTIDFHRANIRKKLGLTNRKKSLRTYLLSLQ